MRLPAISLGLILVALLTGCSLFPQKQTPVTPPPPVAVKPPPPEPPLSIPQTTAQLPSPQPVNPDAIPPPPAPEPAPEKEPAPATRPPRRPAPKADAPSETDQPPAPTPSAETAPAESAPFQAILSPQEKARLKNSIEGRHREIEDRLKNVKNPSEHDKTLIERINSFVNLSLQAAQREDFTQADALLERATILAKELGVE